MTEKRQKWSRKELREIFYCFYYALEYPSEIGTTERTYKLWRERNKRERLYIDAHKLTNVRRDVMKKKRLTDTELQEIKKEIKTIIKKIKEKVAVTEQPENESEDEKFLVCFDREGEPVQGGSITLTL